MLESLWEAGSARHWRWCQDQNAVKRGNFPERKVRMGKEFADSPNRKKRYAEFQVNKRPFCSDVYLGKATSTEGTAWKGGKVMYKRSYLFWTTRETHPNMVELTVSLRGTRDGDEVTRFLATCVTENEQQAVGRRSRTLKTGPMNMAMNASTRA
jgi:hypothetical protein